MLNVFRKFLTAIMVVMLPSCFFRPLLNFMGHRLKPGSKIGFSIVWCESVVMENDARIGNLNFIAIDNLILNSHSYLGFANVLKGPVDVELKEKAGIGNRNKIQRAKLGVAYGNSLLYLGKLSKITSNHQIDCTQSVWFGDFSILAGASSQIWTHGYVHDLEGPGRYRIDGSVHIGDNVYIGSKCLISMGVSIAKGVVVGGGSSVASNLNESGMYVSASLRKLHRPPNPETRANLEKVDQTKVCETVFFRKEQ